MADLKISQLPALATAENEDLLAIVDDPSGSPVTKKITVGDLLFPKVRLSANYDYDGRYSIAVIGSGADVIFATDKVTVKTDTGAGNSASLRWNLGSGAGAGVALQLGSPTFGGFIAGVNTGDSGASSFYFGLGAVTVDGSGHTFTNDHAGFKFVRVGTTSTLYATQADGTTENVSAALSTNVNSNWDLIVRINGTTSADYFYRENGGAWSTVNLTSNLPNDDTQTIQTSVTNEGNTITYVFGSSGAFYER